MRRKPGKGIPDLFFPNCSTQDWIAREFPNADIEKTLAVFGDKARAGGWLYSDWNSALRNYFRNSVRYGGVVFKGGIEHDPRWQSVLHEARKHGFREPHETETHTGYRTQFDLWLISPESRRSRVVDVSALAASKRIN